MDTKVRISSYSEQPLHSFHVLEYVTLLKTDKVTPDNMPIEHHLHIENGASLFYVIV